MGNRYAIHLETPAGLNFEGIVEADSIHEAAKMWASDVDDEMPPHLSKAFPIQDPNYNEEGRLRFTVMTTGTAIGVYSATGCVYVASEFDPKALFREMAARREKLAKVEDEWTVDSLKSAFDIEDILFDIDDEMAAHVVRIVNAHRKSHPSGPSQDENKMHVRSFTPEDEWPAEQSVRYLIRSHDKAGTLKNVGIVDAYSFVDAADKWASGTSGGSRIAIVTSDRSQDGVLDFITAVKTDREDVYVWADAYRVLKFEGTNEQP